MNTIQHEYEQLPTFEYLVDHNVTAKCRRTGCNWEATGSLTYELKSGSITFDSDLVKLCLAHHDATRKSSVDHNQFWLYQNGQDAGFTSVSSAGSVGQFYPSKGTEIFI